MPEEKGKITSRIEGVICIYKDGELVAIVRKNGENLLYNVDKMSFDDIGQLLNVSVNGS